MFPKRTALQDYPARRIALIKPSALGDIVHSLPVLTALRRRYPEAYIAWIVNRAYEPLLLGHSDLNATLPYDRGAFRRGWWHGLKISAHFVAALRRQEFDLVIDLQGLFRSGVMALASGAARRVGLSTAREGARYFYTDAVGVADFNAVHAVDRYWLVAEALGAGAGPRRLHVPLGEAEVRWSAETLEGLPRPWLMLSVGSRWQTKRWPPEFFAELVRRAQDRFGGTVVFLGAGDEAALSRAASDLIAGPVCDLTGRTSLSQLAALLSRADVVLSNDSGPLHLAAALGRPVVAPYTCTRVLLHGPYGSQDGAVETRVHCRGSYLRRCDRMICMTELTPDRLWPVLNGVLIAWESNRRSA